MSINIWEDNWVRNGEAFCPLTAPYPTPLPTKVCELFCEGGRRWDGAILNSLFNPHLCSLICSTPISWTGCADKLIWRHSSSGVYSVNSGYLLASCLTKDHGGSLPSSSYNLPPTIWKLIWRLKVPPRVKHFLWRAIRNALATKENLFSRKCARNPLCDYCGTEVESIEHIFFRFLVRNSDGAVVDINHGRIKVSSALAAKAWAVRIAVAMAVAWGKKETIIESDCKVLVDLLQPDHANTNWTIQAIIDDIVSLSDNANFVFSWCNRKVNSCAHWIASNSRIGLLSFISPCNIPSKLCSLIRMDI
ncbi:hypothetical protein RHGRI_018725 [Rhododendron griersonianum]|uniref:Reverse transcriptase zinc-binding domain-containing protein n=1 Tax=Rhododendron griersonianum TaxID=479676 RepID=A0AAV6K2T5_9ERIC|nr:hypothetical protein RHGRI_018725 [Rhododendron griersonianum]